MYIVNGGNWKVGMTIKEYKTQFLKCRNYYHTTILHIYNVHGVYVANLRSRV